MFFFHTSALAYLPFNNQRLQVAYRIELATHYKTRLKSFSIFSIEENTN